MKGKQVNKITQKGDVKMIRIWIGSLAAYNAGALVGRWVELPQDEDGLQEIIDEINKEAEQIEGVTNAEEVDIFDYETNIEGLYDELNGLNIYQMNELAEILEDLTDDKIKEFTAILEVVGTLEDAIETFQNQDYIAIHDVKDYYDLGYMHIELTGIEIPDFLINYINCEKLGRDLAFDGWHITDGIAILIN